MHIVCEQFFKRVSGFQAMAEWTVQYCTYTVMEDQTKKILSLKTLDKRETEKKSTNLEKAGFVKCLQEIQEKGLTVKEVVTDAHLQIGAMMSKNVF